jgi:hypothetical protein
MVRFHPCPQRRPFVYFFLAANRKNEVKEPVPAKAGIRFFPRAPLQIFLAAFSPADIFFSLVVFCCDWYEF